MTPQKFMNQDMGIVVAISILLSFVLFALFLKYRVQDELLRSQIGMSVLIFYAVVTFGVGFRSYLSSALPFIVGGLALGALFGFLYLVPVQKKIWKKTGLPGQARTAEQQAELSKRKPKKEMAITIGIFVALSFSGIIALVSTSVFRVEKLEPILTLTFFALLVGSLIPYLVLLLRVKR